MKNKIKLFLSFIVIIFFIVFAKQQLFGDSNYNRGWDYYEKDNFEAAIVFFKLVNKNKYPDILLPLGDCYIRTGQYVDAIENFKEAFDKNIIKSKDYSQAIEMLGYSYLKEKDFKNARYYLNLAIKYGSKNGVQDLKFLDSLEQAENKMINSNQ